MLYPLDIHVWPHCVFGYYSKGHHSAKRFREHLRSSRGIAVAPQSGDWDFCWARFERGQIVPLATPKSHAFPVTIWSLA